MATTDKNTGETADSGHEHEAKLFQGVQQEIAALRAQADLLNERITRLAQGRLHSTRFRLGHASNWAQRLVKELEALYEDRARGAHK
jgi:hypothetical protein